MKTIIRKSAVLIIVPVFLLIAGGYAWLLTSLPTSHGTVQVKGINDELEIFRDKNGIPHIFSENESDTAFALGFVHAQDRLWKMEFFRRLGTGRLSEIIGKETISTDHLYRTLGLYRLAKRQAKQITGSVKMVLDAYSDGVNSYLVTHLGALPIEFLVLDFKPEPWLPADSLVWAKLIGF